MAVTKLSLTALALLSLVVVVGGAGTTVYHLVATEPAAPQQPAGSKAVTAKESPAKDDESKDALAEFKKVYALKPGEDLKRVPPPYPDSRDDYLRSVFKTGPLPQLGAMNLRWEERTGFHLLGGTAPGSFKLQGLPEQLAGIYPHEIEGNQTLLDTEIEGDFIARKGLSAQKFVKGLEQILRTECNLAVKLSLREEERTVFVARGKYKHKPIEGRSGALEIYGKELTNPDRGGGGTGNFSELLQHVGSWVGRRIISEVKDAPKQVSWHYNMRGAATPKEHAEDKDAVAVLGHLAEQTGLTFNEQPRKVRVLFVEE